MALITKANLADPDAVYDMLLKAHDGLTPEDSSALNARLLLVLANHIGDEAVLRDAIRLAAQAPA